mmetsp:Transcript_18062/g.25515  ORF Transcript_18062/g.25515 Transcript_18062/m.25515 type:complete len:421 (-) Transcript_18062:408-1670(-)
MTYAYQFKPFKDWILSHIIVALILVCFSITGSWSFIYHTSITFGKPFEVTLHQPDKKSQKAFSSHAHARMRNHVKRLYSDFDDTSEDANTWISSDIPAIQDQGDWEASLKEKEDGSFWSSFSTSEGDIDSVSNISNNAPLEDFDDGEIFLDTIASIGAEEINFMNVEADRADKLREMQERGFSKESISATLGVSTDESKEVESQNEVFQKFQEETKKTGFGMYIDDDIDLQTVESHKTVDIDEDTGDPIRTQMVYVDEHACIGCTNCAMIAQSTFFMEEDYGRARVFQQWGDDDETIQVAIETCPVDCIHYVPYSELVDLEIGRRDQTINFKARLVNQGEYGGGANHRVGAANSFSSPQKISGNMGSRCKNCPTLGCKNCPMYGVGKNPYFEKKEKERKERLARKRMEAQRENNNKSADL